MAHAFLNMSEKRDFFEKKLKKKFWPPNLVEISFLALNYLFVLVKKFFLKKSGTGRKI